MVLGNLIFQTEVVEQRFTAVVLPHHDQQASDDRNQTEHGRMLSSNMLLRNLILLIDVTFSTPTPVFVNYSSRGRVTRRVNQSLALSFPDRIPGSATSQAIVADNRPTPRIRGVRVTSWIWFNRTVTSLSWSGDQDSPIFRASSPA